MTHRPLVRRGPRAPASQGHRARSSERDRVRLRLDVALGWAETPSSALKSSLTVVKPSGRLYTSQPRCERESLLFPVKGCGFGDVKAHLSDSKTSPPSLSFHPAYSLKKTDLESLVFPPKNTVLRPADGRLILAVGMLVLLGASATQTAPGVLSVLPNCDVLLHTPSSFGFSIRRGIYDEFYMLR